MKLPALALGFSLLLPLVAVSVQMSPTEKPRVNYLKDIEPIFKASCLGCHAKGSSNGLDLSSVSGVLAGKIIKPGRSQESKLIHSLKGQHGLNRMPKGMQALPAAQVETFERWIDEGAHFTEPVDFAQDVQPILKSACYSCHADNPKANLDLRQQSAILKMLKPGDAEHSTLYRRIKGYDNLAQMPKGFPALPAADIDTIKRWINESATFAPQPKTKKQHWAYRKLVTPPLPKQMKDEWVQNPIDAFVLQKLERLGVSPSEKADRYTLLRRTYLDLIGIPPTPADVVEFANDQSPDAHQQVVQKLLANPQFGVRQARPWLDLARYADTNGFEKDGSRTLWPWRDWVIKALNSNMPYDQFTIEQLAGDLLKNPTQDQLIATGFNRNTMHNLEGGVDEGEALHNVVIDRVNTTATAFMGTTMACTRCHDHKFDPISQKDYFEMLAYFNKPKITKYGEDFYQDWYEDELWLYKPGQQEAYAQLTKERQAEKDPAKAKILDDRLSALRSEIVRTRIMRDDPAVAIPRTYIKNRGEYRSDTVAVLPKTPTIFGPTPAGLPMNRLGLAKWLVSPQNPLIARVHVNRVWEQYFGQGLVETSEDFGTRASEPSHPELLDWLASTFIKKGWDQKWLHRTIVGSATYQQSSKMSPEALEEDPTNILLARGPRFRMEAEMIRDSVLFSAGLLSLKIGGPSVMPHQPDGVWNSPYSGEYWSQSKGEDLYRRGIFTFIKRTAPYPSFSAFDAPSREECTVRRTRTNTPMQALAMMNDPVMLEASRALGERMARTAGSESHKLGIGILWSLSRPARAAEIKSLAKLLADQTKKYETNPELAKKLHRNPKLAPWTVVGNVILNLDEAITKP